MFFFRNEVIWRVRAVCVLYTFFAIFLFETPIYAAKRGDPAPDFVLQALDGKMIRLRDLRGKFVLINFWATWCVPCKTEMPSLEKLYKRFRSRKFELLAVSNDMFGERVVKPYIEANHFNFPVLIDSQLQASNLYGIVILPTTYLVDPRGFVIGVREGADDWAKPETLQYFDGLLKGTKIKAKRVKNVPIVHNFPAP